MARDHSRDLPILCMIGYTTRRDMTQQTRRRFIDGLESAQRCPGLRHPRCSRTVALEPHRKAHYWKRQVCEPCQAAGRLKAIAARQAAIEAKWRDLIARHAQIAEVSNRRPKSSTSRAGLHRDAKIVDIALVTGSGETLLATCSTRASTSQTRRAPSTGPPTR